VNCTTPPCLGNFCDQDIYAAYNGNTCDIWLAQSLLSCCTATTVRTCCDDGTSGVPCLGSPDPATTCPACTSCPSAACASCASTACPPGDICTTATGPCAVLGATPDISEPLLPADTTLLLTGGPNPSNLVKYYEQNRLAPVCYRAFEDAGVAYSCLESPCGSATCIAGTQVRSADLGWPDQDYFVIEFFPDPTRSIDVAIVYGYGARGSTAAGYLFGNTICPSLDTYNYRWYVYHWIDSAGGDGVPGPGDQFLLVANSG
jgi:hypothetical protein